MAESYPRREKKKQQTRAALLRSAMELFAEKGFEDTTMDNIAQRADLHLQTVYLHFGSKSELAAALDRESLIAFQAAFAERDVDTLTFWRDWVKTSAKETMQHEGLYREALVNLFSVPTMSTSYLDTWFQYQATLAEGIAADLGVKQTKDLLPSLVASMLWGGNAFALRRWLESEGKRNLAKEAVAVVDRVIDEYGDRIKEAYGR